MILTLKDDFRCFKKDESFEIIFDQREEKEGKANNRFIFIIGDNGCGKSTLIKAIRHNITTTFKTYFGSTRKKERSFMLEQEIEEISKHIVVSDIDDYDMIAALDGEMDNPNYYANATSAEDYVDNGGFTVKNMSNGFKSIITFIDWLKDLKEQMPPYGRTLILLDEVDRGWKIEFTTNMLEILNKHFSGCDFLIISHNPLTWASNKAKMYDIETKSYTDAEKYFFNKTGRYLNISAFPLSFYEDALDTALDKLKDANKKLEEYEKNEK